MGHVTAIGGSVEEARDLALTAANRVRV
jgi:hypothetical protein